MSTLLLSMKGVSKRFTLHHQNGAQIPVLDQVNLDVRTGECVVLDGPSGQGKSTLLKLIYANYRLSGGEITITPPQGEPVDVGSAAPRALLQLRRETIGYVSQFLRVIPRVPALDIVAEPLTEGPAGSAMTLEAARETARTWLQRLSIPERLWSLPPATFSGGEQQRINIARTLIKPRPLLLLDEPTASLDGKNADVVITLIHEARSRGAAVIGIFHDTAIGRAVATRHVDVSQFRKNA